MTDYNAPETALLDLDWLLEQASLFITANAVDCELEARLGEYSLQTHAPVTPANAGAAALGELRQEIRRYLSHVSVEEIYDPYLDRMGKLELVCRKAEVERRLGRKLAEVFPQAARQAA